MLNAGIKRVFRVLMATSVLTALGSNLALAQPVAMDPNAPAPTLIEFKPEDGLGEFVGRAEGRVDSEGKRLYLTGLDVMAPLSIHVFTADPAKPLDVSLHRFLWREANQQGRTDERGSWQFSGRIHDQVGIELAAAEPVDYYVLAWRGPVQPTDFGANLFVPANPRGATANNGVSGATPWLAITIVIAIAAIAIVFLLTRRRGNRSAAAALAGIAAATTLLSPDALADPVNANFGPRLAAVESGLEFVQSSYDERSGIIAEELQKLRDSNRELQRAFSETQATIAERLRQHDASLQSADQRMAEMAQQIRTEIADRKWADKQRDVEHAEMAEEVASELSQLQGDVATLYMLVEQDREAIPDPTFGGVDPMASNCYDDPACADCFDAANGKLVEQMELYEKLRSIYSTHRSFAEYVVMTGDALSGFHQLEQAAWYSTKLMIKQAQMNVTRAYNEKFAEFNTKLDGILREFGECEAILGVDDWYDRNGKLFYNSLINGYRVYDDTELPL